MIWLWLELFIGVLSALLAIGYLRVGFQDQSRSTLNFIIKLGLASAFIVAAAYCVNDSIRGIW